MSKTIYEQLKQTQAYCRTLQDNFKNNLDVIEERQNEIEQLSTLLERLRQQNQALIMKYEERESSNQLQVRLVRNEYNQKLQQKQVEMQELAIMIQTKMRKQLQVITQKHNQELKSTKNQLIDRDETNRRLLHENSRLNEIIKQQKNSLLEMESQINVLNEQKNSMSNKMVLHQQELEGIRSCNSSWQDMLKDKLKQAQKEKQAIEEEYSDYKLTVKEKLKKQKDDLNKKILQLSQEKQNQIRQIVHEQKQIKFKYQKAFNQNRDYQKEIEHLREEKGKLEAALAKSKQNQLKSSFQKNQKQYDYLLKIFEQDKRDLKSQIQLAVQEKKQVKQQLDEANSKRQTVEKAVERLKVQLNNRAKEGDELKKQVRKLKLQYEAKIKQYQANFIQGNNHNGGIMMNSRPIEYAYDSKGFDRIEAVKVEIEHSKVFTEDIGPIDDHFFQGSALKSPKNNNNSFNRMNMNPNRQAQLMKKISQLQIQLQQYKNIIKKLREQTQNLKKICEQDKNKEISLYRDKANIYWEKANDKEQQLMGLREQYNELKSNYGDLVTQLKKYKEYQSQNIIRQHQLQKIRQGVRNAQQKRKELQQQLQIITKQRDLLQEISAELRAENHSLRQRVNAGYSADITNPIDNQTHISELPQEEQTIPFNENPPERQRIPKKLHDLVREKKMLSISGKRAAIEQRMTETRLEHIGTDSQKQVLQKIKIKNKTPPKVANYAEMKKQKQRRTSSKLETLSQKQVYERLKARQNRPLSPQKPQRGINYLQLRDLQGLK